jgi:uncharacterized protein (TIGR03437 family)
MTLPRKYIIIGSILGAMLASVPGSFSQGPPFTPPARPGNTPGPPSNTPGPPANTPGPPSNTPGPPSNPGPATPGGPPASGPQLGTARVNWGVSSVELSTGLREEGTVEVPFEVTSELRGAGPWLTPSLSPYISVSWDAPETLMPGETYVLTLTLENGDVPQTLGGTLHLRQFGAADELRRTYPTPLAVSIKPSGTNGEEPENGENGEEEPETEAEVDAVTGAADFRTDGVAPGQIISIFGRGLGPAKLASLTVGANGRVTDYLGDTQVLVNGVASPVLAAVASQINAVVPFAVAGQPEAEIIVTHQGRVSNGVRVPLHATAPALFTMRGLGHGQAAVLNEDGTLNSAGNPAPRGSVITFYGTGLGLYKQSFTGGEVVTASLPEPVHPVSVTLGGVPASLQYVGGAPGMVSAVVQFNVAVPGNAPVGDAVQVLVYVGGRTSRANVTIAVK